MIKRIAVGALLLSLCACGGGSSGSSGAGASGTAGTPATSGTAVAGQTGNSAGVSAKPDGSASLGVPAQLCVFLDRELPKLATQPSPTRAQDKAIADYKVWVAADRDRKVKKAELDAMTKSQCPKVRARILGTLNRSDLATALS